MDIMAKIDELVKKLKADDGLAKRFFNEPVKTLEDLLGVDLPDEQVKALIEGIKAKFNSGDVGGKVNDITDKVEDKLEDVTDKLGLDDVSEKVGQTLEGVADKLKLDEVANKIGDALGGLFGKK